VDQSVRKRVATTSSYATGAGGNPIACENSLVTETAPSLMTGS
jgi:hypothetical protein